MPTKVTLRPSAQGPDNNWTAFGGVTKWQLVSDSSDATGAAPNLGTSPETYEFANVSIPLDSVIASVVLFTRDNGDTTDTVQLRAWLNSLMNTSSIFVLTGTFPTLQNNSWNVPRPGGGIWSVTDVNNLKAGWDHHNWAVHATPGGMDLWIELTYIPAGVLLPPIRQTLARLLARFRGLDRPEVSLPSIYLDIALLDDLGLSHSLLPVADGLGYKLDQVWQPLQVRATGYEVNPGDNANPVKVYTESLREQLYYYWDGGVSNKEPTGLLDGVLILDPYATTRTWDGPPVTVKSPVSGLYMTVPEDIEPTNDEGRLHEGAATNQVLNSAFVGGLTSWGTSGTVTLDSTTTQLFDPSITPQHAKLNRTGGVDAFIAQGSVSVASGYHWLSIFHYEEGAGQKLSLFIQRASDSKWWRTSDRTWQVAVQENEFSTQLSWYREIVPKIDQTAGATTYTIYLQARDVNGYVAHVGHVQFEKAQSGFGWLSSPIVTSASTVTRAASSFKISNNSSGRCLPATALTLLCRFKPEWNSADQSAADKFYLLSSVHDASNSLELWYQVSTGFVLRRRAGGNNYDAIVNIAVTAGTVYGIGATMQATVGENGDPNYTISLTLDGLTQVKTTGAAITMVATNDWYRGSQTGALPCNGVLYDERVIPWILTLAEIRRYMQE